MIDTKDELLIELASDFVDLHKLGAIELDKWKTALDFVINFYQMKEGYYEDKSNAQFYL